MPAWCGIEERGEKMKKIIDGKLYDTEKAEVVFTFKRKYQDPCIWSKEIVFNTWERACYLKTQKGAFLYYCEDRKELELIDETEVKRVIQQVDPDRFIELYGEVEEG